MLQEVRCPTCQHLAAWAGNPHRPFCSERCKLQDIGNWASERYRVAGAPAGEQVADPDDDEGDGPER